MENNKVTIEFPTKKHVEAFMYWLDGSGEQEYWDWTDENGPQVKRFSYDFDKQVIIGTE